MLIAVGAVAVSLAVLVYKYLSSRPAPAHRVSANFPDGSTTAKASPRPVTQEKDAYGVPELSVTDDHEEIRDTELPNITPKQKPRSDVKLMPTPSLPNGALEPTPTKRNAMPPPPRPNDSVPEPSSSVRPPPSAASTLRAPPTHKPSPSSSFAPSASTLPPKSRPSKKVLLSPGHSPLDWAGLTRSPPSQTFLKGSDVPCDRLICVTPSLLKAHNGRKGTNPWGVFGGRVYNMGPYLDFHPGGVPEMMKAAGNDKGEKLFMEVHPWVSWENMLGECCVGILVSEKEGADKSKRMEEMD